MPRIGKSMETESKLVIVRMGWQGGEEGEDRKVIAKGYRVSI